MYCRCFCHPVTSVIHKVTAISAGNWHSCFFCPAQQFLLMLISGWVQFRNNLYLREAEKVIDAVKYNSTPRSKLYSEHLLVDHLGPKIAHFTEAQPLAGIPEITTLRGICALRSHGTCRNSHVQSFECRTLIFMNNGCITVNA